MPLRADAIDLPIPAGAGLDEGTILPIAWVQQTEANWCWAACCQMVIDRDGPDGVSQCSIVSKVFHSDCASYPDSSACDKPALPENVFPTLGYSSVSAIEGQVEPDVIRAQVDAGFPVEIYLDFGSHAHVALISGYYDDGRFEVLDPFYGPGPRTLDQINDAYGYGGSWTRTYVGIMKD